MTLWAVVPVKPFAQAKQRLAGSLSAEQRDHLARLMLCDVLAALKDAPGLAGTVVVTADAQAAVIARALGAEVLAEAAPVGLNAAVGAAAGWLAAQGAAGLLVVPGDAPGVTADELLRLLQAHAAAGPEAVTLVPAHDGDGTNALALSPPGRLAPAFGEGSFACHLGAARAAGLDPQVLRLPGLGLDLDHPRDLARFASRPASTRTGRYLADLQRQHPPVIRSLLPCPTRRTDAVPS